MLPSEGLDDPNQNTYPLMSAHHEDPSKTTNMSWKEPRGKCLRQFFLKKNVVGEMLILPSILKLYPLKKIAARKLDFSSDGIESSCC